MIQTYKNRPVSSIRHKHFQYLLLGEQWDLRNRYLHIHPTAEWSVHPDKYPDKPRHPRQRYLLTVKGQMLYNELMKEH